MNLREKEREGSDRFMENEKISRWENHIGALRRRWREDSRQRDVLAQGRDRDGDMKRETAIERGNETEGEELTKMIVGEGEGMRTSEGDGE